MLRNGRDKRVPPTKNSEGRACHARGSGMDNPTWRNGPYKQVPPRGFRDFCSYGANRELALVVLNR